MISANQRTWGRRLVVIGIWVFVLLAWRRYQTSNGLSTTDVGQRFVDGVGAAWWGALAYISVYLVRPLVLFPASVLTVIGGVLFGSWAGIAIVVVAANGSAMIAYGVARLLGRTPGSGEQPGAGDDSTVVARWSRRLRENSFETVLVMRLVFLPYDLVNYVCGALRIRWTSFLLATALGSLPGTISFVLLGASLERIDQGLDGIDPVAVIASVVVFVIGLTVSRSIRRRQP